MKCHLDLCFLFSYPFTVTGKGSSYFSFVFCFKVCFFFQSILHWGQSSGGLDRNICIILNFFTGCLFSSFFFFCDFVFCYSITGYIGGDNKQYYRCWWSNHTMRLMFHFCLYFVAELVYTCCAKLLFLCAFHLKFPWDVHSLIWGS